MKKSLRRSQRQRNLTFILVFATSLAAIALPLGGLSKSGRRVPINGSPSVAKTTFVASRGSAAFLGPYDRTLSTAAHTLLHPNVLTPISSPSISSISPSSPAVSGSDQNVTVFGSSFQSGLTVSISFPSGGSTTLSGAQIQSVSSGSFLMIATLGATGTWSIRVNNPDGGRSNTFFFTVQSAATPSISSISPTTVTPGTFSLTINGSNFNTLTVQVVVTGPNCPTTSSCVVPNNVLTSKSSSQIVAPVTINTTGSYTIQVQNGSGGTLSNGSPLSVTAATPSIGNISPNSVTTGTFSLTINGSNFNTSNVQIAVTGPNCPSTTSCVVPNGVLTSKSSSQIVGPVTINTAGTFNIQVQNGSGGTLSNNATLSVSSPNPSISNISPSTVNTGTFSLTINGGNFNPSNAQIIVTGPGCPTTTSCVVPNGVLTNKSSNQIVGPVTINTTGNFTIQVQNGSGGALSNGASLTVNTASPSITNISPTSVTAGTFSLMINGSNFDTASAQIVVTGPNCPTTSSCVVPNGVLTSKSSNQIVGPVTINTAGTFTIQVQNGSGGTLSNGATLTVNSINPSITNISPTTVPMGTFSLTINGSNFNTSNAQIVVTGPSCPTTTSCVVPNGVLTNKSSNQIVGPVTINTTGTFTIQVQNGSGGTLSNGTTLTVNTVVPSINSLSPTGVTTGTFSLTINGSNFDPSSAQIVVIGQNCPTTTSCVVPNGVLTSKSSTQIVGPVTINSPGTFTIQVQNGSGGSLSNGATLTVSSPTTPVIAVVSPATATVGTFSLTVSGSNFDPSTAQIVVTGPNCPTTTSCVVPNGVLTTKTNNQLVGPVTINTAGTFTIQVQNGSGGTLSNGMTIGVTAPTTPSISNISPTSVSTGTFSLTITGNNFDTSKAQIVVTGPNCPTTTSCVVPNGVLTSKSSNQLVGSVTINTAGNFTIQVQNGAGTPLSNGASLSVTAPAAADAASFVTETVLDKTIMPPSQAFTKTWTLRNSGTSTWNSNYKLRWLSGAQLSNHADVPVSGTVPPNGTFTFSVPMTAPGSPGEYRDDWKFINDTGATVMVGAFNTIWVDIQVSGGADAASFVSETIGDGTPISPGQTFIKTWTIRNSGTTTWTTDYSLRWVSGASLSNHAPVSVVGTVTPGGTYTFSIPMKAPSSAGNYQENWQFTNGSGAGVRVGTSNIIWVNISVSTAPAQSQCGTADQMRARIQQRIQDNLYVVTYQPAQSDVEALLGLNLPAYDELYFSAFKYRALVQTTLLMARKFIDQGNLETACTYLRRADRIFNLRTQLEGAAALVWDTRVSGAQEVVKQIISTTCSIEVGLISTAAGLGTIASALTNELCTFADYAVDKSIYGEDQAFQNLKTNLRDDVITTILHVPIDGLGGSFAEWVSKGGFNSGTSDSVVRRLLTKALQSSAAKSSVKTAIAALGKETVNERLDYFAQKLIDSYLDGMSAGGPGNSNVPDGAQNSLVQSQDDSGTGPSILSVTPAPSSVFVSPSLNSVSVTFADPITAASLALTLTDTNGNAASFHVATVQGNSLVAPLPAGLQARGVYTVTLLAGAVQDLAGVSNNSYQWAFSTAPPNLAIGANVQVANTGGIGVALRNTPNMAADGSNIISVLGESTRLKITGGPQQSDGYVWWNVTGSQNGWIPVGDWLRTSDPAGFSIGTNLTVSNTGANGLPMRDAPSSSAGLIKILPDGASMTILSGPYLVDGFTWWNVINDGVAGFSPVAYWLTPDLSSDPQISTAVLSVNSSLDGTAIRMTPIDINGAGNGKAPLSRTYSDNAVVSITAPATSGAGVFKKWQKDSVDWSTSLSTSVTMNGSHTMSAIYSLPATVQYSSAVYSAAEGDGHVEISVTRSGDTSTPGSVAYATTNGSGTEGKDYVAAQGTLSFAAGETTKSFSVLLIDNAFLDGVRTVNLSLSDPSGSNLATPNIALLIINDNDATVGPNPLDAARSFVQLQYYDFLSRYPDLSGWDFWTNQITSCGTNQGCVDVARINTSGAFFLSIEFQQTGYLVERMYKSAYGDAAGNSGFGGAHQLPVPIVRFGEFLKDTQRIGQGVIVNQTGWEQQLENNKQTYANEFVQTQRFRSTFPIMMTAAQFVDKLNQNAGNVLSTTERTTAINLFGGAADSSNVAARAQAMRQVAEDADLASTEKNRAFVLAQYFGYLRRDPNSGPDTDYTGYDFWLTKLNQFNGNFIAAEMVKAFISSSEYRQRFGP